MHCQKIMAQVPAQITGGGGNQPMELCWSNVSHPTGVKLHCACAEHVRNKTAPDLQKAMRPHANKKRANGDVHNARLIVCTIVTEASEDIFEWVCACLFPSLLLCLFAWWHGLCLARVPRAPCPTIARPCGHTHTHTHTQLQMVFHLQQGVDQVGACLHEMKCLF